MFCALPRRCPLLDVGAGLHAGYHRSGLRPCCPQLNIVDRTSRILHTSFSLLSRVAVHCNSQSDGPGGRGESVPRSQSTPRSPRWVVTRLRLSAPHRMTQLDKELFRLAKRLVKRGDALPPCSHKDQITGKSLRSRAGMIRSVSGTLYVSKPIQPYNRPRWKRKKAVEPSPFQGTHATILGTDTGAHNGLASPVIWPLRLSAGWAARREGPRSDHGQFNAIPVEERNVVSLLWRGFILVYQAGSNGAGARHALRRHAIAKACREWPNCAMVGAQLAQQPSYFR